MKKLYLMLVFAFIAMSSMAIAYRERDNVVSLNDPENVLLKMEFVRLEVERSSLDFDGLG